MSHLDEEQLVEAYYAPDEQSRMHMRGCPECRAAFERVQEHLDALRDYPVPERGPGYGGEVWKRLLPQLPPVRKPRAWLRLWLMAPAFATLLAMAFVAGMLTQRKAQLVGTPASTRERVLLIAMNRHLERSQIILSEIANGSTAVLDFPREQERARDLLDDNRLLRQAALRDGDAADASLLDELERVLLDVANSPAEMPSRDLEALQNRIDNEGLVFKVRVRSSDVRFKGQQL
ncbi:MAG: hypothetical protein JO340_08915 [Acidobacteriaceae bacterium]|nr:hypothetical protein [Acidobacteriaceae bacterium]